MDYEAIQRVTLPVDVASGFGFLALGLWILSLRPRQPSTLALGTLAATLGTSVAVENMGVELGILSADWVVLNLATRLAAAAALLWLALVFPGPLPRVGRARVLGTAALIGILQAGVFNLAVGPVAGWDRGVPDWATPLYMPVYITWWAAIWAALALFALRHRAATSVTERRALVIVSVALGLEMSFRTGILILAAEPAPGVPPSLLWSLILLVPFAITALWLRNTANADPEARRHARHLALFFPSLGLAGALFTLATDRSLAGNLGPMGITRIAGILLLAYAILRGLLPGIDAKVRFALSRSSIAAAFIAVFFIASETAQQFFGDTLGGTYVGIAAAGMLVFAMAPLQRVAERLAERAVPVAAPAPGPPPASDALRDLQQAYAAATRDGRITHEEELALARLATRLGFDAATLMQVRKDAIEQARGSDLAEGERS